MKAYYRNLSGRGLALVLRAGLAVGTLLLIALNVSSNAVAAELNVGEGVVVKFAPGARLVVRDTATFRAAILTAASDDSAGGPIGSAAGVPTPASWGGVRVEKSGSFSAGGATFRYAGQSGEAAVTLRGANSSLNGVLFNANTVGLRLLEGASPTVINASFLSNVTGVDVDDSTVRVGESVPSITSSQLVGNTVFAINNRTPGNVIQATGNWWGHGTGPREATANPSGMGDAVSTGVNFAGYLVAGPLLNPRVSLAGAWSYYQPRTISLDLSCVNATDYRLTDGADFGTAPFVPLTDGHALVEFTTTGGEGIKFIRVEFRNASGAVVSADLGRDVFVDTTSPILTLTNPSPGATHTGPSLLLQATASDGTGSGVGSVEFYVDGTRLGYAPTAPYEFVWPTGPGVDGLHTIKVVATDRAEHRTEKSATVNVTPDAAGPLLADVMVNGSPLSNGAAFERNATIGLTSSDVSGVGRVELLLDGNLNASTSGSGHHDMQLNLSSVANGVHTLVIRALDSRGNVSSLTYSITVAHAPPGMPTIWAPADRLVTRTALQSVSGTASPGLNVQLLVNSLANGGLLSVGADGRFYGSVTLVPGANQIQATVTDAYGTSAPSIAVNVTLDTSVPASPTGLTVLTQPAGKVRLSWARSTDPHAVGYDLYRASNAFAVITEATKVNTSPLTATVYDDMPPSDATWTYRVVAVNALGTPSLPTNAVQATSDATLPKALSIIYTPLGRTDAATGRIGQGRVNLVLTTNEVLLVTPYLSIVPQGGVPIPVELVKTGDTTYAGNFLVDANTPAGTANALFSARDAVGNRGTDVLVGATLNIDTAGPSLVGIVLTPAAPIKNEGAPSITAALTFSKPPTVTPVLRYKLSAPGRVSADIASVSATGPTTYTASFTLPADAGGASPETLSFSFQAQDDLDNISTKVSVPNRFQVYQGSLPPLDTPFAFTAKAQPAGKVRLTWQAVAEASAYQIYRQAPGQTELLPLMRTGGIDYIDTTPQDGAFRYAVATVRQFNGQESVSVQTAYIEVLASATAPGAPQNLALQLTGTGIYATWQAPVASTVDYYNLYRASGLSITSIDGLSPLKTRIRSTVTYDTSPSPTQGAYVVTSVDAAGNESAISNSAYLNASLLPVRNLTVQQLGDALPVVSWTAPNGALAGYLVYIGPEGEQTKITPSPITGTSFSDTGYASGERRYTVASVDASSVEMPRSITLPRVSSLIASGLPIKRGVMNKLQVQVSNTSASALDGVRVVVRLPTNAEATVFKDHKSEVFRLGANDTRLVPVIVGGYTTLSAAPQAQVGVEIAPAEGELVKIAHNQTVDVTEGTLVVGMATEEFTRGATGKLKLTIENTTEVDIELLTATGNGNADSTELRFKILDADGNVLATQPYKQVFGTSVVTLTNGQTVARIPAGASYVSDVFSLNVPGASPASVRVKLEVDKLRYHSGQEDEVLITGRGSERTVSLIDTAYLGELTDVSPINSFGDQDVIISGRALERATRAPMPNTRLKLVLNQQGFERIFTVLTDSAGNFAYTFKPTFTDAGLYKVSAVHPDITDRPEQKSFVINRVTVGPTPYKLDVPKNFPFNVPFTATAGPGTAASNLRLVLNPANQPTGQLPEGISIGLPAPVSLTQRQTLNVPVQFSAGFAAQPSGSVILDVFSDEHAGSPLGQVKINYTLSEAKPFLVSTPSMIETGMSQGGSQIETLTVKNNGLYEAQNLVFTLTKPDGSPAPSWASIGSVANGTLAIGAARSIDLAFTPPIGTPEAVYEFKLKVVGDNVPAQALNVYVSLTQSGQGNVLFHAADIYTATLDSNGQLIRGLANASVTLQNEDVSTITAELNTDALGEALFQNLPAGRYKFRAKANNHQEIGGRLTVKPGITANQPVFLDYNLITVEWSVREITIQDRYEITLNATFETNVPAAVVVLQPASINLPKMNVGDVYYGELNLTNYGLVRADKVRQHLPASDAFFRYEFLVDVPPALESKQRITLPYRVVAIQSLEGSASAGGATGGGCYSYSNSMSVSCEFQCANGAITLCGAFASFFSGSSSTCTGGTSTWGTGTGGNGGGGPPSGGGFGGGGTSTSIKLKGQKCVYVPMGGMHCE